VMVWDKNKQRCTRTFEKKQFERGCSDKGKFRHFMRKEIFEQPTALEKTLKTTDFSGHMSDLLSSVEQVQIVACGTSFYAGLVAKSWIESMAEIACEVDIASEFRYRKRVAKPNTLMVFISQSGETADTLAALRGLDRAEYSVRLCICNVAQSTLVRACDWVCLTKAGPEIGVASTKAFTTQLAVLLLLTKKLSEQRAELIQKDWDQILSDLPKMVQETLAFEHSFQTLAKRFEQKKHALFLGRGIFFPIALEGALKLKEISYIHAEAYPAGELKHGPLALVDKNMPVIVLAPNNALLDKIRSNIQEVCARGGQVIVLTEVGVDLGFHEAVDGHSIEIMTLPKVSPVIAPIIYTIPLQLLAYHVAVLKGTDVDQPRNLAKSVTVE
jgi:glutamine---fructose-6-phosphate transaminase (isomerizing)